MLLAMRSLWVDLGMAIMPSLTKNFKATCACVLPYLSPMAFNVSLVNMPSAPVGTLSQRPPSHQLRAVIFDKIAHFVLLEKHMRFKLQHGRLDFHILGQVKKAGIVEVAQPDCSYFAIAVGLLHSTVSAVIVSERLVA